MNIAKKIILDKIKEFNDIQLAYSEIEETIKSIKDAANYQDTDKYINEQKEYLDELSKVMSQLNYLPRKLKLSLRYRILRFFTFFIGSIVLTLMYIFIFLFWFERPQKISPDIKVEIDKIDNVSKTLQHLDHFIIEYKKTLLNEQAAIENLKNEKEKLEPLVESDREIVESLFLEQERRQYSNKWKNRIEGYITGIVTSLISAFLFLIISARINRKLTNKKT